MSKPKGKKDAGIIIKVHPEFKKMLDKIDEDVPIKIDNPQKTKLITDQVLSHDIDIKLKFENIGKKKGRTKGENRFVV